MRDEWKRRARLTARERVRFAITIRVAPKRDYAKEMFG